MQIVISDSLKRKSSIWRRNHRSLVCPI